MDGVVANFDKRRTELGITTRDEWKNWKVPEKFFCELEPIEGAIESVKALKKYYEVYFLSTPQWSNPFCWMEKRLWVEQHFGESMFKRLILSHNKGLLKGDYLVDDIVHEGFEGEHIHFGTERFPDWNSVYEYLTKPAQLDRQFFDYNKMSGSAFGI